MNTLRKTVHQIIEYYEDALAALHPADRVARAKGLPVECPVEHAGACAVWTRWRNTIEQEVQDPRFSPSVFQYPSPEELPLSELDP